METPKTGGKKNIDVMANKCLKSVFCNRNSVFFREVRNWLILYIELQKQKGVNVLVTIKLSFSVCIGTTGNVFFTFLNT